MAFTPEQQIIVTRTAQLLDRVLNNPLTPLGHRTIASLLRPLVLTYLFPLPLVMNLVSALPIAGPYLTYTLTASATGSQLFIYEDSGRRRNPTFEEIGWAQQQKQPTPTTVVILTQTEYNSTANDRQETVEYPRSGM